MFHFRPRPVIAINNWPQQVAPTLHEPSIHIACRRGCGFCSSNHAASVTFIEYYSGRRV